MGQTSGDFAGLEDPNAQAMAPMGSEEAEAVEAAPGGEGEELTQEEPQVDASGTQQ
mgnify:CR=1 FL=1